MQLKRRRPARGVMLLEVLVAMLLASLAVMALVGVQASTLQSTRMSQHRALAALLLADLSERLRASRDAAALLGPSRWLEPLQAASGSACESVVECSSADFMQADLNQWRQQLARVLPLAAGHVQMHSGGQGADVWVVWREPLRASDDRLPQASAPCPSSPTAAQHAAMLVRCVHARLTW